MEHDPDLGETPDGGITLYGAGTASIWTGFDGSTFTGPIRARDGARLILCNALAADCTAVVESGARLNDWQGGPVVKNLTLGTAGSSVPAVLELRRDVKGYGLVVTNALSVLSPVAVTTHNNTHDLAPYPVDGTYTALVYSAANADVDLSLFTSEVATATVSARQVTVADGGDYHLVFALTPDKPNHTAFSTTVLNLLLEENEGKKHTLSCDATDTADGQNHFWLLKKQF